MATITNKNIIYDLLKNDGRYLDDPQVSEIYSYKSTMNGELLWGVYYGMVQGPYGEAITDIQLLWTSDTGFTTAGHEAFLEMERELKLKGGLL